MAINVPPGQTIVNCYHFNQKVSTNKPQVSTFSFPTTMEDAAERGRGRGRERMRGGGRVRGGAGRGAHGQRRQQDDIRNTRVDDVISHDDSDWLTERAASHCHILFLLVSVSVYCL